MRAMSTALINLLATGNYVSADCWTITLSGGVVVRWTNADKSITANSNLFAKGPGIVRGSISEKRGVEVATLDVSITATSSDLINGTAIIPFIAGHGFDGALVKLERAFAPNWVSAITGTVLRFSGKVTSIKSILGATADLTVSSWLWLLSQNMPRELFQAGCLNTLYDSSCTLNPASFSVAGHTTAGGQTVNLATNLTPTLNDYALGRILFTSGVNNGISRTIKSNDAAGNFVLVAPLPAPCGSADNFTAYKGCDLTQSTCTNKFNNLVNFRATPYVPQPTTALGSATTTTTKSGK